MDGTTGQLLLSNSGDWTIIERKEYTTGLLMMEYTALHDFMERWKRVNEAEKAELKSNPVEVRIRQTSALLMTGPLFEREDSENSELLRVAALWNRLRKAYEKSR